MAASHRQTNIVRMLIDAGASLRCKDDEDTTPLLAACTEGNVQVVKKLFKAAAKSAGGWVTIQEVHFVTFDCNDIYLHNVINMLLGGFEEFHSTQLMSGLVEDVPSSQQLKSTVMTCLCIL